MSRAKAMGGAILLLSLAACRAEPSAEAPVETSNEANAAAAELPDADINASLGILSDEADMPDEASGSQRFVGRWAAVEGLCDNAAWTFTATELRTPAGSVCRFTGIDEVPGGYDIAARCTAEGPERDDVLELRFAESAGALLFDSESIADAGLIRCED
jgi:hypothetical protein